MPDERERLRRECHEDLDALRASGLDERAFRLLEKLTARLDRLETGSFEANERATEPARVRSPEGPATHSSATWRNDGVLRALEEGKDKP